MSFAHCSTPNVRRAEAPITGVEDVSLRACGTPYNSGGVIVIRHTGRTVGSVTVTVTGGDIAEAVAAYTAQGSDLNRSLSTDGITYIKLDGAFPIGLAVHLVPVAAYDGDLSVDFRTASIIGVDA